MHSTFLLANEVNRIFGRMDEPITKGPVPRWQRKGQENISTGISLTNLSLNSSRPKNLSMSLNSSTGRSPGKKLANSCALQKKKTPSKSPGRSTTPTPNKNFQNSMGDRFIPSRNNSNFELAYYKNNQKEENEVVSPAKKEIQRIISENLHGADINKQRIFSYLHKAPAPPLGFINPQKVLYTQSKSSMKSSSRYIPQAPDRILDAPDIIDDYYLNLMDWSSTNILAVALRSQVYLWDAGTGNIELLLELEGNDYVCSLSWSESGDYLAVGTTTGAVELWDRTRMKRLRVMKNHSSRVCSLAWNYHILTSGSRSGQIIHHDVRQAESTMAVLNGHAQEVCGLRWSPDGKMLASGGNDNVLNIWAVLPGKFHTGPTPLHVFTAHQAAVKALAWCPWNPHILVSGGGTADRCLRFWNCNTGALLNVVDTKSQVCSVLWSINYKELISGHGYANNQLIIWKYPSMAKVAELTGHTARVLHLAMSPDSSTVLSAGADETLRLWKCFMPDPLKKEAAGKGKSTGREFSQCIR